MKILFVSYWGIEEGLTAATVLPHLQILDSFEEVSEIFFYTIERGRRHRVVPLPRKVVHCPLKSGKKLRDKFSDFIRFPRAISKAVQEHGIDFMFCRGTPAGALGYLVHRRAGIGYAVESFEPHASYMIESGVWNKWGLRYLLQRWFESKQIKTAQYLLPVAHSMKPLLEKQQVKREAIMVMPCAVDQTAFSFDEEKREAVRTSLKISPDCVTGIYVGKFGGLYYDAEAFKVFQYALSFFPKFRLIILTPDSLEDINV